jgi:small subunit ribosomal protein S17
MAKKKTEEIEETVESPETEAAEETAAEAEAVEASAGSGDEAAGAEAEEPAEEPKKKRASKKSDEQSAVVEKEDAKTSESGDAKVRKSKRAEKIGIVASDKMTKTVVVRVDRLVKHPVYRKYVRRRKKFMAHDETGAKIGDKVRIVETRPLSARKRWRVIEIIQRAEV